MLPLTAEDRPHLERAVDHYLAYLRATDKNTGPYPELLERLQRKEPASADADAVPGAPAKKPARKQR